MSHTPGPWVIDAETGSRRRNAPPTILMVVAERGGMPGLIVNQGAVEQRDWANARLIAAAPELLKACKQYVACDARAHKAIIAAIAKAESI